MLRWANRRRIRRHESSNWADYRLGMEAADESSFAAGERQYSELGQNDDGYEYRIYQPK